MKSSSLFALLAWAGVVVVAVVAGEKATVRTSRSDRVTVIYWEKWTGQEGDAMRKVVNDFNQSQERIFVEYLSISGVDQKTMLATSGSNPPDIAGIWLEQVAQFADAGALTDLTQFAKDSDLTADYYIKAYWDPLNYRSKLWALPSTPSSVALHVRSDLMPPEANTPEKFPKTIEGLDELATKISKKRTDGSLEFAGFMPSSPGWAETYSQFARIYSCL
jgi:multiple sugar transport system substrate-binding protein